jgi:Acid Phosphatase
MSVSFTGNVQFSLLTFLILLAIVPTMMASKLSAVASRPGVQHQLPKLIAFDLDGTIWTPDMYQLWGGGSPFTVDGDGTQQLFDRSGTPVKLLGISSHILETLKSNEKWSDTVVAWVSCTDEPTWAAECLNLFKVGSA